MPLGFPVESLWFFPLNLKLARTGYGNGQKACSPPLASHFILALVVQPTSLQQAMQLVGFGKELAVKDAPKVSSVCYCLENGNGTSKLSKVYTAVLHTSAPSSYAACIRLPAPQPAACWLVG